MELLHKGGVVVWVLMTYSVIGLAIVISGYLRLVARRQPDFNHALPQDSTCEYGRIFSRLISSQQSGLDQASLRALALRLIDAHIRYFERGLKTLSLLANTAPLLGLLGTIIGMISAFRVIESQGAGVNPQMLAGGIWEAMLTTGAGLAVALPLLVFFMLTSQFINEKKFEIALPQAESGQENSTNQLELISIKEDGSLFQGEEPLSAGQLKSLLARMARDEQPLVLRVDEQAPFEPVMALMDQARQQGVPAIGFAVQEPEGNR